MIRLLLIATFAGLRGAHARRHPLRHYGAGVARPR